MQAAAIDPEGVFKDLDVAEDVKQSLIQDIQLRLAPQALKLRSEYSRRMDLFRFLGKAQWILMPRRVL